VDGGGGVGVDFGAAGRRAGAGRAAGESGVVAREPAVVGSGLAVLQVDLEAEHGLDPTDRELEVRAEAGPGVPLAVAVPGEVSVVEIPAHRGDLIEETAESYLRGRSLGDCGRGEHQRSEDCKDGNTCKSAHSLS